MKSDGNSIIARHTIFDAIEAPCSPINGGTRRQDVSAGQGENSAICTKRQMRETPFLKNLLSVFTETPEP